ncbi:SIR2 family protein [Succinatimonas hippei]|uniref:SIR2 family protein n=1 Tax=Succinatimonas hippei TaxID=626938 RepID=UPI0026F35E77|nr:SIR2 family protein [Succinatimonas hippei]
MKFIDDGVDIPENLIREVEEGRVVFFCGAGVSCSIGLCTFSGLVNEVYRRLHTSMDDLEEKAYKQNNFDRTLGLLEKRIPGSREKLRAEVFKILEIKDHKIGFDYHSAILKLSEDANGNIKLITTNFDRAFEIVKKRKGFKYTTYKAPALPLVNSSWNGVVYIHGLMPSNLNDISELNNLVLTSGDFGKAYLLERWASNFIVKVFSNYSVCFIGYSVNDPLIRYALDAMNTENIFEKKTYKAWVFDKYEGDTESELEEDRQKKKYEWEKIGLNPILYEVKDKIDHSILSKSIIKWAKITEEDFWGRKKIINSCVCIDDNTLISDINTQKKLLWSLNKHDECIKYFSELKNNPSIIWLNIFCTEMCKNDFEDIYNSIEQILEKHPESKFAYSSFYLFKWMLRHINDERLLLWMVKNGCRLHDRCKNLLAQELFYNSESINNKMYKLWSLLLIDKLTYKSSLKDFDLFRFFEKINKSGLTIYAINELKNILAPKIEIYEEHNNYEDEKENHLEFILNINCKHAKTYFLQKFSTIKPYLADMFETLDSLLNDALNLYSEIEEIDSLNRKMCIFLWRLDDEKNYEYSPEYTIIIYLLKESILSLFKKNVSLAKAKINQWLKSKFSVQYRLAIYIYSQNFIKSLGHPLNTIILNYESSNNIFAKNEIKNFFLSKKTEINNKHIQIIENKLLKIYEILQKTLGKSNESSYMQFYKLLYLLKDCQIIFTDKFLIKFNLTDTQIEETKFSLYQNERNTLDKIFPGLKQYCSSNEDFNLKYSKAIKLTFSQPYIVSDIYHLWEQLCSSNIGFFLHYYRKNIYCKKNSVNSHISEPFLQILSNIYFNKDSSYSINHISYILTVSLGLPLECFSKISINLAFWLDEYSKKDDFKFDYIHDLLNKFIYFFSKWEIYTNRRIKLSSTIFSDSFHIFCLILINIYSKTKNINTKLSKTLIDMFERIIDLPNNNSFYAKAIIASFANVFYSRNKIFYEENIKICFDWEKNPELAAITWDLFLSKLSLSDNNVLINLKEHLIKTSLYLDSLNYKFNYVRLIVYNALLSNSLSSDDIRFIINNISSDKLIFIVTSLFDYIGAIKDKKVNYKRKVFKFWGCFWPKDMSLINSMISEAIVKLCLTAGKDFPAFLNFFDSYLVKINNPCQILYSFLNYKDTLFKNHPKEILILLDKILPNLNEPVFLRQIVNLLYLENKEIFNQKPYVKYLKFVDIN